MTTDDLKAQVSELQRQLDAAKKNLANRLLFEFPAKAGDIIIHPRLGEYLIERLSGHYDGVSLYLHKKTAKGWDKRETTVADMEDGVLNGIVTIRPNPSA